MCITCDVRELESIVQTLCSVSDDPVWVATMPRLLSWEQDRFNDALEAALKAGEEDEDNPLYIVQSAEGDHLFKDIGEFELSEIKEREALEAENIKLRLENEWLKAKLNQIAKFATI